MEQDVKIEWEKILCRKRFRPSSGNLYKGDMDTNNNHRNEFDKDYDRIVYSSSVRRLQDKAQVFPLQENDFTRNRLTHSLEVSALARSFGYAIGDWLLEKEKFKSHNQVRELSALLQVSALIHDLGNPPFGHYGEDIIRNWFKEWFKDEKNKKDLTEQQITDLENFEGNAQTLRIVSKLQLLNDQYGVNFTYGTLSTIMKYPWNSNSEKGKEKNKFAYFSSEERLATQIMEQVGLKEGVRHPVTYLLEASDDIAYLLADVEDAVKKGIIPWEKEYDNIKENLQYNSLYDSMFIKLDDQIKKNKENKIPESNLANIQNFKVKAQGIMFNEVVSQFKKHYGKIMTGTYGVKNLLECSNVEDLVDEMKRLAKEYCYTNKEVLTLELVGDKVITGLLDIFIEALVDDDCEVKPKKRAGKLYYLISDNFKYICCLDQNNELSEKIKSMDFKDVSKYNKLLLITDFISGMTDSYAVNLYKQLTGVRLP